MGEEWDPFSVPKRIVFFVQFLGTGLEQGKENTNRTKHIRTHGSIQAESKENRARLGGQEKREMIFNLGLCHASSPNPTALIIPAQARPPDPDPPAFLLTICLAESVHSLLFHFPFPLSCNPWNWG